MPVAIAPDLIELAKSGDHQAFQKVVETHQGFVYAVAFKFLGNRNEAEDMTQEAFIKLWRNMKKYRREVKLSTWLYKIIMNLCLDFLKSTHHKQQLKHIDVESNLNIVDKASEDSHLDDREMLKVIIALAKQLTAKQQTAFTLRDLESLPVDEVCEISGMNTAQLKSNLYYARINIREGLTRYYRETNKF